MELKVNNYIQKTDNKHSDMVDAMSYKISAQIFKLKEEYVLLHIKKKPRYLPEFIYKWILSKILILTTFK